MWGIGAGAGLWEIWERRRLEEEQRESGLSSRDEKGKGRAVNAFGLYGYAHGYGHSYGQAHGFGHTYEVSSPGLRYDGIGDEEEAHQEGEGEEGSGDAGRGNKDKALDCVVVFACGHIFHRTCLHKTIAEKHAETVDQTGGFVGSQGHDNDVDEERFKCPLEHLAPDATAAAAIATAPAADT